jgi:hypothetical protein
LTGFRLVLAVVFDAMAAAGFELLPALEGPMQTLDMPKLDMTSAEVSASQAGRALAGKTAGWLVRRTLLWAFLVALGVAGACILYTAVGSADADADSSAAAVIATATH